tara:strand:- start:845 stop:1267 length:423 start_codon:yes stop_codon:yes gene_type:complete
MIKFNSNTVSEFVNQNIHFLNNMQVAHWQTKSYSEHEGLSEFYTKFNNLNDRFVETWQGKHGNRIKFNAEYRANVINYADLNDLIARVKSDRDRINEFASYIEEINEKAFFNDIESILEDMQEEVSQLLYHLSLRCCESC